MPSFADRLKELRIKKNLTQKQMAEFLNITERYYQKFEYGKVKFSQENLIKIADYFNVPVDYLLGRTDEPGAISITPQIQTLLTDNRLSLEAKGLYMQFRYYAYDNKVKLLNEDEFCKNHNVAEKDFDEAAKELQSLGYLKIKPDPDGKNTENIYVLSENISEK